MNKARLKLLLTRPYSWMSIVAVAILASVIARGALITDIYLAADIVTAMVFWLAATSMVEYFHRKIDGRGSLTNPYTPVILMVILASILFLRNPYSIVFLLVIVIADYAYSMKIKDWALSGFSFMIRGVLEVSIFLAILSFYSFSEYYSVFALTLAIYFLTNARNLIGDIRDVQFDKFVFPKKYGVREAYWVSMVLIATSIVLVWDIMIAFPVIVFLALIPLFLNAYSLHRIFILVSTFFYINYAASMIGWSLIITNLLFLAVILNFTYPMVPRKSNPKEEFVYRYGQ